MRLPLSRPDRPPALIALAGLALVVGLIDVVSALTPEMAERVRVVSRVLSLDVQLTARGLTLASGIALLLLASSLARRKHRAWVLAVVLVSAGTMLHLVKGLDLEESLVNLALLVFLIRSRRWFDAPGDPASLRLILAGTAVLAWLVVALVAIPSGPRMDESRILHVAMLTLAVMTSIWLVHLWLRPWREPASQTDEEHDRARKIVLEWGEDSLSFFALRRDRRYAFSEQGDALLAYRVVAGCALVSGDPIGNPASIPDLVADFAAIAHRHGWRLVVLHCSEAWVGMFRDMGLRAIAIGDEAVLHTETFSLEGRAIRKVRQSVTRLQRLGHSVSVLAPAELDPAQRAAVERVSQEWLNGWPDRGFSMAMDDLFAHPQARFALAHNAEGELEGFLHLVPSRRGYSLSSMRRLRSSPNGLIEFLIAETVVWAKQQRAEEISLNFSVFADVLRADGTASWPIRATRWSLLRLDRLFQLERLFSFNRKFFPEWRRRYICFERHRDVPLLGVATLHVERLLAPPRRAAPRWQRR
ncbi:MAG: lysyl-tRNA synthetase, class [Gaiellales bacterium]|jgi:lysyl-tRNA synthetase class 2|nr:lysyl-tRNA synthetase, class [Gaiellales bacterium]